MPVSSVEHVDTADLKRARRRSFDEQRYAMSNMKDACNKAIAAHANWKYKFKDFVAGKLELDAHTVRRSDACEFGKWLADEGKTLLGEDHSAIHHAHCKFHVVAADVVEAHAAGAADKVSAALAFDGAFGEAGAALTNLVMAARDRSA